MWHDAWKLEGLRTAVRVDGELGARHVLDRGWTVELALPWAGLRHVLDGDVPPGPGQRLRLALARNQVIDQGSSRWTTQWSWHVAGSDGLWAPEAYPVVEIVKPQKPWQAPRRRGQCTSHMGPS